MVDSIVLTELNLLLSHINNYRYYLHLDFDEFGNPNKFQIDDVDQSTRDWIFNLLDRILIPGNKCALIATSSDKLINRYLICRNRPITVSDILKYQHKLCPDTFRFAEKIEIGPNYKGVPCLSLDLDLVS